MKKQEHLFVIYPSEQDLLRFYANLPKKAKKKLRLFPKWHVISMPKEDYEVLKDRVMAQNMVDEQTQIQTEASIQYTIHQQVGKSQVIPWGVTKVKAPEVWETTEGAGIKVGILDTGIDGKHPDLRGQIKGGVNTIDSSSPYTDDNGHGTHVAGTVAALNNQIGVVGVAPKAELYALKCFSSDGTASLTDIAQAIDWAIDQNIRILNMSFGSREPSQVLHRAIKSALKQGIIMIASSGNSAESVDYPARHAEVLAVGALGRNNKVASFSNYGNHLNYVQPGVDILSTWPVSPGYSTLSGTSMATPHLTGICALLLAQAPELTPIQLKKILDQSTVKLSGNSPNKQGLGLVTASKAQAQLMKWRKK